MKGKSPTLAAASRTLELGLTCCAALGAVSGCISKSTYLAKVDEAVRFRSQAEVCENRMRQFGDIKTDLEEQLRALDKRRAVADLEGRKCRADVGRLEAEVSGLRETIRKSNDDINELRAKLAVAEEQARGLKDRASHVKEKARKERLEREREPDLSDVAAALKNELEGQSALTLAKQKGAMVLRIPQAALFRRRTAILTRNGRELLGRLADALARLQNKSFHVQGHQDATRVPRKLRSPQELSFWQAVAVASRLTRAGMDSARVSASGFGAARPLAAAADPEASAQNRRIEIVITPAGPLETIEVIGPSGPK